MSSGFEDDFFQGVNDNPFEDASIKNATASHAVGGLDDYNPFEDNAANRTATTSRPAVMQATQEPPVYNRTAQQTQSVVTDDFQKRQAELDRKAAELDRKEAELKRQSEIVAQQQQRRNNWPPLPDGFCVQPCFYLDIEVEIKTEFQRIVRHLYYLWMLHECMLVCNVIGSLALWVQLSNYKGFFVSIFYLLLFTPLSFLCWYRPVYNAFKSDSSIQFMVFFFVFFFQFLMTAFMAVGVIGTGACGIWTAISCFDNTPSGTVVGIIVLLVALGLGGTAGLELLLLGKMMSIYRGTDASFNKARTEFTSGILGNQFVRDAATDAAAATIRSQLNQPSNRY